MSISSSYSSGDNDADTMSELDKSPDNSDSSES